MVPDAPRCDRVARVRPQRRQEQEPHRRRRPAMGPGTRTGACGAVRAAPGRAGRCRRRVRGARGQQRARAGGACGGRVRGAGLHGPLPWEAGPRQVPWRRVISGDFGSLSGEARVAPGAPHAPTHAPGTRGAGCPPGSAPGPEIRPPGPGEPASAPRGPAPAVSESSWNLRDLAICSHQPHGCLQRSSSRPLQMCEKTNRGLVKMLSSDQRPPQSGST